MLSMAERQESRQLGAELERLRPELAVAAQRIVDEWEQDEEGMDPELGGGGICDRVAYAMLETLYERLDGIEADLGAPEGHDHEWVVVTDGRQAFIVDIPAGVYETGGGYSWRKVEGARVSPSDIIIEPIDQVLADGLVAREEQNMYNQLKALTGALYGMGEHNTAMLVSVLDRFARQAWVEEFFAANPELMRRAEKFAEASGVPLAMYLNRLESMPESAGRRIIHKDLGYVGMPWSPSGEQEPKAPLPPPPQTAVVTETDEGRLAWPFPPPVVLKDPGAFMSAALGWAGPEFSAAGERGEIAAARAYLDHLRRVAAPAMARTLQRRWAMAAGDPDARANLRKWWQALAHVWQRLRDMAGYINSYKTAPSREG